MKTLFKSFDCIYLFMFLVFFYNIFFGYDFNFPLGYDEIVTVHPVGTILKNQPIEDWFDIIFSRFLSEDHLLPLNNLFSFFILKLFNNDINTALFWTVRICYLIISYLSYLFLKELNFSRNQILIFFIFFLTSGSISYGILSLNLNLNLVTIFTLLTLIFYLRSLKLNNKLNTLLTLIFLFLGLFTFENFYIIYPYFLVLTLLDFNKKKYKVSLFLAATFLLLFKFAVSFYFLGTFLPNSRVSELSVLKNSLAIGFKLFSDIASGLPLELYYSNKYLLLLLLPFIYYFIYKLFIIKNKALLYIFLIPFPFILYTGRYHPGMWIVPTIIGVSVVSSIVYLKLKDISRINFLFPLFFLFFLNQIIKPHSKIINENNEIYYNSNLAYKLINPFSQKIITYTQFGDNSFHPVAFWLGNEISKNRSGLSYSPISKSLHIYNIDIEQIKYDSFPKFIPQISSSNTSVILKHKNEISSPLVNSDINNLLNEVVVLADKSCFYRIYNNEYYSCLGSLSSKKNGKLLLLNQFKSRYFTVDFWYFNDLINSWTVVSKDYMKKDNISNITFKNNNITFN